MTMITVLYVDDEPGLLEICKIFLEQSGRFTVVTAGSAQDGLLRMRENPVDCIVSDYLMPEMDGIAFLKTIRGEKIPVPFILFTGRGREEVVIQALNEGADFYLQKGGDPKAQFAELAHKIRSAVNRRREEEALGQSEEKYHALFNQSTEGIYLHDLEGRILDVNTMACMQSGYSREEWLGLTVFDGLPDESTKNMPKAEILRAWSRLEPGQRFIFEGEHQRKDGTVYPVEISMGPIRYGNTPAVMAVIKDITDRKRAEEELIREKTLIDALFNSVPGMLYLYDEDGQIVRWNRKHEMMTGYTSEEMSRMHLLDWFRDDEKSHKAVLDGVKTTMETGFGEAEAELQKKDGTRIPMYFTASPLVLLGKRYFAGLGIDITDRRRAEDALRESGERFRTLVETSPDMIWEIDCQGTFRYISPRVRDILGYEPSELIGGPVTLLVAEHARPFVMGEIAKHAAARGGLFTIEVPAQHKDGRDRVIEVRSAPFPGTNGAAAGLRGTAHDITSRRKALAALAVSGELFRKLVATVPDIVVCTDLDGRITYANEKFLALEGSTDLQEITGTPVFRYFAPEDLPRAIENIRLRFERQMGPVEYTFITRDGTRHLLEINGDVFMNPDGSPSGMVYVGRDVSERKKIEEAMRRAHRQLSLLSSVTRHDILNKVSVQLGLLALAEQKARDSPEMAAFIKKLESAATAIRDQIGFTRIYQDLGSHEPRWQDLHQTLAKITVPAHISLSDDCAGTMIYADVMLEQVFANLIDNAVRHGGNVTKISMTAEVAGGSLVIRFIDNGAGIPVPEKEKIFGRGYGKNTGLGLFLVREILSLTGITIRETGEPGSGARFEITVPEGRYRLAP